jgi:hypothetical protein
MENWPCINAATPAGDGASAVPGVHSYGWRKISNGWEQRVAQGHRVPDDLRPSFPAPLNLAEFACGIGRPEILAH